MREIKFRAWDKNEKILLPPRTIKRMLEAAVNCDVIDIDDAILMQYTGLKDMNGKEIYEGDIVNFHNGMVGEVVFTTELEPRAIIGFKVNGGRLEIEHYGKTLDVIGNKYENPELMEKTK